MVFAHRNLRTSLVLTLALLVVVSGSLGATPVPPVEACNTCSFLLTWGSTGTGNGEFNDPFGVAVDSGGNVFVADSSNNRVEKFTSTGTFILQWGSTGSGNGKFNAPNGVAVDSAGNVYIADYGNSRIQKFSSTGTFITKWGSPGSGPDEFNGPQFVAVDSTGNVYVTDAGNNRVEKFTSAGIFLTSWTGGNPQPLSGPTGVAVDSAGDVYVADSLNRVEKFTGSGAYITAWGCADAGTAGCGSGFGNGGLETPYGVAVDSAGNVYVVDQLNERVEKFTSTGTYITAWGCANAGTACSYSSGPGEFSNPIGVAVDSAGNVYVADELNNRVELFSDPTTSATIALVTGWNLISLPLVPSNTAIGNLLAGLIAGHNLTIVWSFQGGVWKSFTPPATGTLKTMQDGFGYWIYVTHPSTLYVLGFVIVPASAPPSYSLSAGWNLLGFKPQPDPTMSETVSTYLTSISGDYTTNNVWLYDNPTGTWIRSTGSTSIPVGDALWVYMTTPATLRP